MIAISRWTCSCRRKEITIPCAPWDPGKKQWSHAGLEGDMSKAVGKKFLILSSDKPRKHFLGRLRDLCHWRFFENM